MADESIPLVTIGICTYNRADGFFPAALQSALAQTYSNLEVVVSDNHSTDHTEEVVRAFGDPRVRYVRQERNIGPINNFNACLAEARGDWFLLLHDDDLIDPDMVEACMAAAGGKTSAGVLRTGTRVIDDAGETTSEQRNEVGGDSTGEFYLGWFAGKTSIYLCGTLHNTRRLKERGGFRSRANLYLDTMAIVELAARFGRVDVAEVKASFRRHGNNHGSRVPVDGWREDSEELLELMCELAPAHADQIRAEGIRYFSDRNYRHAASLPSLPRRLAAYWRVYRTFDYGYSPLRFVLSKWEKGPIRRLRRRLGDYFPHRMLDQEGTSG